MLIFLTYLRKVMAFSVFVAVMSSLPIGAIAPEYRIAYLVVADSTGFNSQPDVALKEPEVPQVQQEAALPVEQNSTPSIPDIPKIAAQPEPSQGPKPLAPTPTAAPVDKATLAIGGGTPTHIVAPGETLSGIAQKYNLSVTQLCVLNGINNAHIIRPGQELLLAEEPPQPRQHTVRSGENLSFIAATYGVTVAAIVQLNDLPDINRLRIGQVLNIPQTSSQALASRSSASAAGYIWPLIGTISSYFGERRGTTRHSGLDVAAPRGRDIKAARAGRVESAGWMGGYGNAVIIDHGEGIKTLYAHASKLEVKRGDRVVQGQIIARVGSTGNSTGPHLHFEVRINNRFMDPLKYLPRY